MDRQTLVVLGGFFLIMVGSAAINNLTSDPFLRAYAFPIFMGVFVAFIVGQDLAYRLAAAEYLCLRMTIRPSGEVLWLWAKTIEPHTTQDGRHSSIVRLAFPTKELAPYGRIRTLIINSKVHLNRAIKWGPGEVWYKETQIKHGRYTQITVDQQELGASNLERGYAEPVFYLRESTNYLKEAIIAAPNGGASQAEELSKLENALAQKTYEAEAEHKLRLQAEEMVEKIQTELQARLGIEVEVNKLALIKIMTILKLVQDLEKVANMLGRRTSATYIKYLVPGLIAALVIMFFWTQPQLWDKLVLWFQNPLNQLYALIVVAIVSFAAYMILRHRRRTP